MEIVINSNSKKSSIISNILNQFKSQFVPEKVDDLRITTDGNICVPVGDKYIAITKNNKLFSYPKALTFPFPVYTIRKPKKDIKLGDIVKGKNSYGKVVSISKEGTIKILTYKGTESTKKDVTDAITNMTLINVVVNMFEGINGTTTQGINPMMFMLMEDQDFDMKDFMMLQMLQGNSKNITGSFNPMLLMMLDKKSEGSSDSLMDMMLLSQMTQGNSSFNLGSLFGTSTEKPEEIQTKDVK